MKWLKKYLLRSTNKVPEIYAFQGSRVGSFMKEVTYSRESVERVQELDLCILFTPQ